MIERKMVVFTVNIAYNKVYAAPFAVFLNKDDMNYVEPDIVEEYSFGMDIPIGIYDGFHINVE